METPTIEHLNAVKRILCHITGTIDYGCHYRRGGKELKLLGFSDSDMGGDVDTRTSTTGVMFYLGSCPVTWHSQMQKAVVLSSCEVEYIAGTVVACQGVWLPQLLAELKNEQRTTFLLKMDSQCHTQFLCQNEVLIICMTQDQWFHTYGSKVFTDNQISQIKYNYYISNVSKDYADSQRNGIVKDLITPQEWQPGNT
jgi:hypothetical protein